MTCAFIKIPVSPFHLPIALIPVPGLSMADDARSRKNGTTPTEGYGERDREWCPWIALRINQDTALYHECLICPGSESSGPRRGRLSQRLHRHPKPSLPLPSNGGSSILVGDILILLTQTHKPHSAPSHPFAPRNPPPCEATWRTL